MSVRQVHPGVWYFTIATTPPKSGYLWARNSGSTSVETFASPDSDALPFDTDTTLIKKPLLGFGSMEQFLSFVCGQYDNAPLFVWDLVGEWSSDTHTCGVTAKAT